MTAMTFEEMQERKRRKKELAGKQIQLTDFGFTKPVIRKGEKMKCCLCNSEIEVHGTWAQGHNAQPLKNGRCCDSCNSSKVIPERIRRFNNETNMCGMQ